MSNPFDATAFGTSNPNDPEQASQPLKGSGIDGSSERAVSQHTSTASGPAVGSEEIPDDSSAHAVRLPSSADAPGGVDAQSGADALADVLSGAASGSGTGYGADAATNTAYGAAGLGGTNFGGVNRLAARAERSATATTTREPQCDSIIETRDVIRMFGSFVAVSGASLSVKRGSVTALIGPNGSGKTTLMLMLAGLLAPNSGQISVCGLDPVKDNYAVRSQVGWMPDQFGMWDTLTCYEALVLSGATYRMTPADSASRATELLKLVHLTEFTHQQAHVLSRGQKQRLGLARALMHNPKILILDEPANGLDPRSRIELRGIIRELAEGGTTILISSHVLAELDEMVDSAIFISGGRTVAQETVDEARQARTTWQVRALDRNALVGWLDSIHIAFAQTTDGSALVNIAGEQNAARFIKDAVSAGVPIVEFRPQGGALESTYLALNEERR